MSRSTGPPSDGAVIAPVAVVEALRTWTAAAQAAYAPNTLRAWRADWAEFQRFCALGEHTPLPAAPLAVRLFIHACVVNGKKPATIRRHCATITRAHRAADRPDPCSNEIVKLALKAMARAHPARQRQARALGWAEIQRFQRNAGDSLRARREKAILGVAYDTLARRSELVALNVADISTKRDGTGSALIRRSKTDPVGEGAVAYLSADTLRHLRVWLDGARIEEGALFRSLVGRHQVGRRLHADQVSDVFKRVARRIGLSTTEVSQVSGHSVRVGAAQDLLALNIELPAIMQAGRWKDTRMPLRYAEQVQVARGGMARAARAQGRDGGSS